VTAALFGLHGAQATPWAIASVTGRTSGTAVASSARFAVTPVTAGTSVPSSTVAFTTVPVPAYLDALNTGTIPLVGMTYGVNLTYAGLGTPVLTLAGCPGGTWNGLGTCSTAAVTIGTWTPGSTATVVVSSANLPTCYPASVGSRLPLKATISGVTLTVGATATLSLSVSSGPTRQIRAATTSNR
jgi:hypothetical protein